VIFVSSSALKNNSCVTENQRISLEFRVKELELRNMELEEALNRTQQGKPSLSEGTTAGAVQQDVINSLLSCDLWLFLMIT
jgi:hypothetical protein